MHRSLLVLFLALSLLVAGCGGGAPTAVTPETSHDFGKVPMTHDLADTRYKEFLIRNEGTGNLKLSNIEVRLLEGC